MANKLALNLSGGMNVNTSPLITRPEECELALNFQLDKIGSLTKRKGYATFADEIESNRRIQGLFEHRQTSTNLSQGTQVQLAVSLDDDASDVAIYRNVSGTWTSELSNTAAATTTNHRSRFASFLNRVHHVNGTADLINGFSSADGDTWNSTNMSSAPTGIVDVSVFQDRLYFIGRNSTNERSRVYFSSLPSSGAITWDTSNDYFDVNPDDGDALTGGVNNGNRLLLFKHKALYRWTFGQVEADRIIGVGTSSIESVRTNFDIGVTFFANSHGVYAYSGGRPKLLSRKIQPYIDAVSDWYRVCAEIDRDHYYLFVGDVTVDGKSITNAMLVYNVPYDAWTVFSLSHTPFVFARMFGGNTDGTEDIYFGTSVGQVFKLFSGTSDNTATIVAEFKSRKHLVSFPNRSNITDVDIFASPHAAARVQVFMDDNEEPQQLGQLKDRITNFSPKQRSCNTVQVGVTDNSSNDMTIEGYNLTSQETSVSQPAKRIRKI